MALVELRAEPGVSILTLNRPEKRNAITSEMQAELMALLRAAECDDAVIAVIIAGAGPDFCVGGDFEVVGRMVAEEDYRAQLGRTHAETAECILAFPKPTIAAVRGRAFGFGAELAAFCDMVVMSENARFADPHVKMGLPPAPGALLIWPQRTSRAIAAELMLTGREVGAQEALRMGLCNRIAPEGEELAVALELARTLLALPREGVLAVKQTLRQSYASLLAEAVQALYPGTQITFGPATDDGFYYDFAPDPERGPFTEEDLPAIEEQMRKIIEADKPLRRQVWSREDLIARWKRQGESFKAEWARELPEGEELTVYWSGEDWLDMCRGPHLPSTGKLDPRAFKLTRVSGAYWRGDQKNAMLSRIYGTGWLNKKQLDAHLHRLEEAAKRDHRKLAREMDLFHLQEEAHGSVFWHPKGYIVWRELEAYMRRAIDGAGYSEVKTPQVMDARQWEQSGHWGKYRENMFVIPDEIPNVEDEGPLVSDEADWMALKPMNCPAHVLIFRQGIKSYRDLPLRIYENGCCHRNEPHGALHGLMRVRQFTQDDAHIFCREDQIVEEVRAFCELANRMYKDFGFSYAIKLALRPENRIGGDELWDKAEAELRDAVAGAGLATPEYGWEELPGEGAFYAPKLEWHLTDAIGRTWQVGTIQSDRLMPERLDASYIGEDGEKHRPIMLHRAIFGSYERFIGILIEHFAGRLPVWLAPVQAVVATIVSDADDYALQAEARLKAAGIRVETDLRNEKINYKVREHSVAKVPHLLVVGKREAEQGTVAIRTLGEKEQRVIPLTEAIAMLKVEATPPDLR